MPARPEVVFWARLHQSAHVYTISTHDYVPPSAAEHSFRPSNAPLHSACQPHTITATTTSHHSCLLLLLLAGAPLHTAGPTAPGGKRKSAPAAKLVHIFARHETPNTAPQFGTAAGNCASLVPPPPCLKACMSLQRIVYSPSPTSLCRCRPSRSVLFTPALVLCSLFMHACLPERSRGPASCAAKYATAQSSPKPHNVRSLSTLCCPAPVPLPILPPCQIPARLVVRAALCPLRLPLVVPLSLFPSSPAKGVE